MVWGMIFFFFIKVWNHLTLKKYLVKRKKIGQLPWYRPSGIFKKESAILESFDFAYVSVRASHNPSFAVSERCDILSITLDACSYRSSSQQKENVNSQANTKKSQIRWH